jgi:hypothetical protein
VRRVLKILEGFEDRPAKRVAQALRSWFAEVHLGAELEAKLGLRAAPGEPPFWSEGSPKALRSMLIVELSRHFEGPPYRRAKAIAAAAARYETDVWPVVRDLAEPPASHTGVQRLFWRLHLNEAPYAQWPVEWRVVLEVLQKGALESAVDADAASSEMEAIRT